MSLGDTIIGVSPIPTGTAIREPDCVVEVYSPAALGSSDTFPTVSMASRPSNKVTVTFPPISLLMSLISASAALSPASSASDSILPSINSYPVRAITKSCKSFASPFPKSCVLTIAMT